MVLYDTYCFQAAAKRYALIARDRLTVMLRKEALSAFLMNPYVDKCIAALAVSPLIFNLYDFVRLARQGNATMYTTAVAVHASIIITTFLTRRVAVRVSLNPFHWFITLGRAYWIWAFMNIPLGIASVAIAPTIVTGGLFLASVAIMIISRFSLGRNVGALPAQREIVTSGAYAIVRHPIHAGLVLFLLSYVLANFSFINCVIVVVGWFFIIVKSLIEENFLSKDAEYKAYAKKVRWRWIPGVI